jgi:hypothetical protein
VQVILQVLATVLLPVILQVQVTHLVWVILQALANLQVQGIL